MNGPVIYCIENLHNGLIYVGCAVHFGKRVYQHKRELRKGIHHSRHLQHAWNCHGEDAFRFFVLEEIANATALLDRESAWIVQLRAAERGFGYNLCMSATNRLGLKNTPEQNAKIGNGNRGLRRSPELRRAMSEQRKGKRTKPCPSDVAKKIGDAQRGVKRKPLTDEHREKISARLKGRVLTPREFLTPEHKAAISAGLTGKKRKPFSAEHRAKIAEAVRQRYARERLAA